MKLEVLSSLLKNRWMEFSPSVLYERLARWILSLLIIAILYKYDGWSYNYNSSLTAIIYHGYRACLANGNHRRPYNAGGS